MSTTRSQDDSFGTDFLERIVDWIARHLSPEQVFDVGRLEQWAYDNGYVKGDEA